MNNFVGIDVHKDSCHATVQDRAGEIVKQGEFTNSPTGFEKFFDEIDNAEIAIEAGDAWQPVYDWLDTNGFEVKLAHPKKTRIIAEVKIKTDCRDSEALADLVRADLIPEVYVPCDERRKLRKIVKQRVKLVKERTKYKNKIRAELREKAIEYQGRVLWTEKGKSWLQNLEISHITDYLEIIETLNNRISKLEEKIEQTAGETEEAQLLMTIPGVSHYTALTIIAEIATVERFPNSGKLCSYAGLVPSTKQSGSKETHGHVQGGRPLLRWVLVQTAWNHINNSDSFLTSFFERLTENKHSKVAIVATARKLLKAIYWMLKLEEEFHPEGYDPRTSS